MRHGWLHYLNLNGTDNSTYEFNYRQQECAFWSEYMPSVVGVYLPTYKPFTEVFLNKHSATKDSKTFYSITVLVGTEHSHIYRFLVDMRYLCHFSYARHPLLLPVARRQEVT